MLKLSNIRKEYRTGDTTVEALKGVSIEFRKNEFVSILGQSGCGKTTLLNIIGGLDQYTEGDLIINGKSTKEFKDRDWDAYRNHSVGFVFQSYNLIPHQSVLSNVELALTISGVSKAERRKRAIEALNKVGLGDQINKKPNQMSGGQMQRVAIARAIVNDPEILLADEPTGALDSETSVQIMELLKEIASDRLVIMVTHNPELAMQYSTRIVKLLDGQVTDDSNPYNSEEEIKTDGGYVKKPSMSFFTALSLSMNNLLTKKARTFLTSFAGSIGIIGIALILSLSSGVDAYINKVEEDTLTGYPITIEEAGLDISEFASSLMGKNSDEELKDDRKIYSNNIMTDMMTTMINGISSNNLKAFKEYIENGGGDIKNLTSDIKYKYSTTMNIYTPSGYQVSPNQVFASLGYDTDSTNSITNTQMQNPYSNTEVWNELIDNDELMKKQYDVIAGRMPEKYNEIVVIVDDKNRISDYTLYSLGLMDADKLTEMMKKAAAGEKIEETEEKSYTFDEILDLKFKLLVNSDFFEENADGTWTDKREDKLYISSKLSGAEDIKVVGILRTNSDSVLHSTSGSVGYRRDLMTHLIDEVNNSKIAKQQQNSPDTDVFTGRPYEKDIEFSDINELNAFISALPTEQAAEYGAYITQMQSSGMSDTQIIKQFASSINSKRDSATYSGNLSAIGVADLDVPSGIDIYPKDFEAKESISDAINDYNSSAEEKDQITYTDYIGLMLSSVTTIINAISYILIAFVSISLVVSSIMIGIITYISVLERTKEIGVLRAMGASKSDISRVFNAETLIVGFVAGAIGIGVTLLLILPINIIIKSLTDISGLANLPVVGAVILVAISMLLTFIAGLIPSKIAARKDPVTSLRTE